MAPFSLQPESRFACVASRVVPFAGAKDSRLEVLFAECVLKSQEIKKIRISKDQVWRHSIFLAESYELFSRQLGRLAGNARALIKHSLDFVLECPDTPSLVSTQFSVEFALDGVLNVDQDF
jgi:hypothetical protein